MVWANDTYRLANLPMNRREHPMVWADDAHGLVKPVYELPSVTHGLVGKTYDLAEKPLKTGGA